MSKPKIEVRIESPLWARIPSVSRSVRRAAEAIGDDPEVGPTIRTADIICIALIDDEAIAVLNEKWRARKAPTNVLSFPAAPGPLLHSPRFLGDLALAFETIEREARSEGKPFRDHLAHLVVHGILHLLGYEHADEAEAERMEEIETRILASVGIADPHAIEVA